MIHKKLEQSGWVSLGLRLGFEVRSPSPMAMAAASAEPSSVRSGDLRLRAQASVSKGLPKQTSGTARNSECCEPKMLAGSVELGFSIILQDPLHGGILNWGSACRLPHDIVNTGEHDGLGFDMLNSPVVFFCFNYFFLSGIVLFGWMRLLGTNMCRKPVRKQMQIGPQPLFEESPLQPGR